MSEKVQKGGGNLLILVALAGFVFVTGHRTTFELIVGILFWVAAIYYISKNH